MNKAIKANLGGIIFHIDDDAYNKLQQYFRAVENQFGNNAESKEIMADIELRMAELFQNRLTDTKQVITNSDVDEVIAIMGQPADYVVDGDENPAASGTTQSVYTGKRRFYRDIENKAIGGVCSGIGAYFGIDPVLVRIIFVILFFIGGATFLIYIILWIALPAAITTAQKLEMRGEEITISNIERAVKQEYEQVRDTVRNARPGERFRDFADDIFHVFGTVIRVVAKIFVVFLGIILVFVGSILIIAFVSAMAGLPWMFHNNGLEINNIQLIVNQFVTPINASFITFVFLLLVVIPTLAILYLGVKLIFRFKVNDRYYLMGSLGAWILCIVVSVILIVKTVGVLGTEATKTSQLQLKTSSYKTLVIKGIGLDKADVDLMMKLDGDKKYYVLHGKEILGQPELLIQPSNDTAAYVEIERKSRGSDYENAYTNSRDINFAVSQADSVIHVDKLFGLNGHKWRFQEVEVKVYLPKGTKIFIDPSLKKVLSHAQNNGDLWPSELVNKQWEMGSEGLKEIEK